MSELQFRLATESDRQDIIQFTNTHWGSKHPLINLPYFFDYYYKNSNGTLRFALALQGENICALAGYCQSNSLPNPDIWLSIWVANPTVRGAGLELMGKIPSLTKCRTMACNNIRPKTRAFYEFLGYTSGQLNHYYRLAPYNNYGIAKVQNPNILPVFGKAILRVLPNTKALNTCAFTPPKVANPYKDAEYIKKRYFEYPKQKYTVYAAYLPKKKNPFALLCLRVVPVQNRFVLRLADYIGAPEDLPQLGCAINELMQTYKAEYADIYSAGISAEIWAQTGFSLRCAQDVNIIPTYLSPLAQENVDFYYFTSRPENFTMFRADGDQDRPNISVT